MRENGGTEDDSVNVFRPSIGSVVRRGNRGKEGGTFRYIRFKVHTFAVSVEMPGRYVAVRIQCRELWIRTGAPQPVLLYKAREMGN